MCHTTFKEYFRLVSVGTKVTLKYELVEAIADFPWAHSPMKRLYTSLIHSSLMQIIIIYYLSCKTLKIKGFGFDAVCTFSR